MSPRERLQRFLAQAGVASRRAAEALIVEGRVRVNGRVTRELGTQVDPERDQVEVDGRRVRAEYRRYVLLYKPRGVVTTLSDPEGRPTVRDWLPTGGPRLVPVGRLDVESEGALLCTNDGDLAHALTHPRFRVAKRYLVRVRGHVDVPVLGRLSAGVTLEDGPAQTSYVGVRAETASHTWLDLTVHEGRNRLVRRLCEAVGLQVMRLLRVEFAGLSVENLRPGAWRELDAKEVHRLRDLVGLPRVRHTPKPGGEHARAPAAPRAQQRRTPDSGRHGRDPSRQRPPRR